MIIHGFQLRLARHACDLTSRDIRKAFGVSLTTLGRIEACPGPLPKGETQRQPGTFEPQIVEGLIGLYESLGVVFLAASSDNPPGLRYAPSQPRKPSNEPMHKASRTAARKVARKAIKGSIVRR